MSWLRVEERQARLHRAATADLGLDAADPDRLGADQDRRERHLVQQFPGARGQRRRQGRRRQGRHVRRRRSATPTPIAPISSSPCARGRSAASASSGRTSRSTPLPCSASCFYNGATPQTTWATSRRSIPARRSPIRARRIVCGAHLQPRRAARDRQPQFRDRRHSRRDRRQRDRRRPGAGHLRLSDQRRNTAPASTPAEDRRDHRCSARAAMLAADLLPGHGLRLLAGADRARSRASSSSRAGCRSSTARPSGAAGC